MSNDCKDHDTLVPDPQVCAELGGISTMSLHRYDRDEEMIKLGWPPPIRIKHRKYRMRRQFEQFKAALMRRAIEQRRRLVEPAV